MDCAFHSCWYHQFDLSAHRYIHMTLPHHKKMYMLQEIFCLYYHSIVTLISRGVYYDWVFVLVVFLRYLARLPVCGIKFAYKWVVAFNFHNIEYMIVVSTCHKLNNIELWNTHSYQYVFNVWILENCVWTRKYVIVAFHVG